MIKKIMLLTTIVFFSGCAMLNQIGKESVAKQSGEPEWLLDPYYQNDKIAAVGCAKTHFKGESAQKKLAISRAIDAIATQNNVTVNNATLRNKSSSNGQRGNSSSQSTSLQSVDNVKISTKTKAIYTKPNGEICAWVVQR